MTALYRPGRSESPLARRMLIGLALATTALMIGLPVVIVFEQAFAKGVAVYAASLTNPDTLHAMILTLIVAAVAVPVNIAFGIAAAWTIAKFDFPLKRLLVSIIELPFSVSPIVAGVSYLMMYGGQSPIGAWLEAHGISLMFQPAGIVLVTIFVTSPFVARELLPLMEAQGREEEEAAAVLGARGLAILWRVTLPNVRWALLYGAVLCAARAIGEFGAVSVVSGNVRGETNTLPLHIEVLYHDYNVVGAFAAATVLTLFALVGLLAQTILAMRMEAREGRNPTGAH